MSFSNFYGRRASGLVVSRRALLGGLTVLGTSAVAGCAGGSHEGHDMGAAPSTSADAHAGMDHSTMHGSSAAGSASAKIGPAPAISPAPGQRVVEASLTPKAGAWDIGGTTVQTWAYGGEVPGTTLRATAGDFLRVSVDNQLTADTTVHWHGVRLRNAADGVPGLTQDAIAAGQKYVYEFTAPDPGTYFFHPHVGTQLDRGMYAPLIIEDPAEPGKYDAEWVIVIDDWIDGTGKNPDQVLAGLLDGSGMAGMDHGAHGDHAGHSSSDSPSASAAPGASAVANPFGDAGDVQYPHYLINGKAPAAPATFEGKPGQRVRLRFINAGADTIFAVALGGHRLTITHTDGHAVEPTETGAFYIGMGERYDATVTLGDGAFPLVAEVVGKSGRALAVVRTASGTAPGPDARVAELAGPVLEGATLRPAAGTRLPAKKPAATLDLTLDGQMMPYTWGMNGKPYGKNTPLQATSGERLRLNVTNKTTMVHPLHLHGPAFELVDSGLRKDTLLLKPLESRQIDLDPEVGEWMVHCHNVYHGEAGMMIALSVKQ